MPVVRVDRRRPARRARRRPRCRAASRPSDRYQSIVLSSPSSSRIDGCSVCDRPRTLSSVACAISPISRRSAAQRRALRRLPCRRGRASSPSPSESGRTRRAARARSRAASTRGWRSAAAPARGAASDSDASSREQPPVGANQVQAGRGDRDERRGEEPVDLPLHAGRRCPATCCAVCSSLSLFCDQQPRDRGAERRLPRLQRQPDLRARLVLVAAARPASKMRSAASQNCATELARYCAAPASGARPPTSSSRFSASSRSARMRSNCADQAVSGYGSSASSMSRIASPSWLRSFWMRSSCSESLRLRSVSSVCSRRRPEICRRCTTSRRRPSRA